MTMPGRSYTSENYRFGFNGMEKADDIAQGDLDFGARIFDSRLGRWLSLDPLQAKYPGLSPYSGIGNNPISFIDPDGRIIIWNTTYREKRMFKAALKQSLGKDVARKLFRLLDKGSDIEYVYTAGHNVDSDLANIGFDKEDAELIPMFIPNQNSIASSKAEDLDGNPIIDAGAQFPSGGQTSLPFMLFLENYNKKELINLLATSAAEEVIHNVQYDYYTRKFGNNVPDAYPTNIEFEFEAKLMRGILMLQNGKDLESGLINDYAKEVFNDNRKLEKMNSKINEWYKSLLPEQYVIDFYESDGGTYDDPYIKDTPSGNFESELINDILQ